MDHDAPRTWDAVRARLADATRSLRPEGFVVLGEPPATPRRVGLLRRTVHPPTRYVQVLRVDDQLQAECVGSTSFGGPVPVSPEVDALLVSWGWAWPEKGPGTVANYVVSAPVTDPEGLDDLCTRTLELLGLEPADLVWTVEPTG